MGGSDTKKVYDATRAYDKFYKGKKVLVTGGLGMIGSNAAIRLVEAGAEVTIADQQLYEYGGNDFNIHPIKDYVILKKIDIRDKDGMAKLIKGKDLIFNYAAQVSYGDSMLDPVRDLSVNCLAHLNMLLTCKEINPDVKLMYPGSRMQYGKIEYLPVDEKHPLKPDSIYAADKKLAEDYYRIFFENFGIKSTCFRIANPYGPRSQMKNHKYSILNYFLRLAMDNQPIKIFGDGAQNRDYIYIDDLIDVFLVAGASEKTDGQIFNIGAGIGTPMIDMARKIVDIAGQGSIIHVEWPKNYKTIETGDYITDITKIKSMTGWRPKTSLDEGISRTLEYYKKHREHYW